MSADACLAFFGIRMSVRAEDVLALEERRHPDQKHAREARLSFYWGDFGYDLPDHCAFVGMKLGIVGPEGTDVLKWTDGELSKIIQETTERLRTAGFEQRPELHIQWMPDR